MKNYNVVPFAQEQDFFWAVVETTTEQVIKTFFFQEDAVELQDKLNRGYGFDGFTPGFFNISFRVTTSIDDEFDAAFA